MAMAGEAPDGWKNIRRAQIQPLLASSEELPCFLHTRTLRHTFNFPKATPVESGVEGQGSLELGSGGLDMGIWSHWPGRCCEQQPSSPGEEGRWGCEFPHVTCTHWSFRQAEQGLKGGLPGRVWVGVLQAAPQEPCLGGRH